MSKIIGDRIQLIQLTLQATSVRTATTVRTVTSIDYGPPPGGYPVSNTCSASTTTLTYESPFSSPPSSLSTNPCLSSRTSISVYTAPCATAARPTASVCTTPTGRFRITIQNFGAAYLTSTASGANPNSDHQTLGLTSDVANAVLFSAISNRQATIVTTGGLTLYSDQDGGSAGNGPVYFDSVQQIAGYDSSSAVQFCLQPDNTFLVQNPIDGATDVRMCAGVVYLFTGANGARSGCTPVILQRA